MTFQGGAIGSADFKRFLIGQFNAVLGVSERLNVLDVANIDGCRFMNANKLGG